jgi:hypothetical protein
VGDDRCRLGRERRGNGLGHRAMPSASIAANKIGR